MAILYGTQSNGETLPVLVDQFGNLLAKGIEGQPGTPGEPGPPGADGGSFPLPPDPYEGAFLGWLNNELAWIGTPPVPIPSGVFGPIANWNADGLLTVEGEIPVAVKQGVYVYQCNLDGSIYVRGWNNSQVWSSRWTSDGESRPGYPAKNAFNGTGDIPAGEWNNGTYLLFDFSDNPIDVYSSLKIRGSGGGAPRNIMINSNPATTTQFTNQSDNTLTIPLAGESQIKTIRIEIPFALYSIWVNDERLVDAGNYPDAPNLNFRVQSVNGQNLIGTTNRTEDFTIGKYLRIPEQNVARWLYDGNLSKVITSTDIDFSRLIGN